MPLACHELGNGVCVSMVTGGAYSPDFGNHSGYDTTAINGSGDTMPYHANMGTGPYSVLILSQDNACCPSVGDIYDHFDPLSPVTKDKPILRSW